MKSKMLALLILSVLSVSTLLAAAPITPLVDSNALQAIACGPQRENRRAVK